MVLLAEMAHHFTPWMSIAPVLAMNNVVHIFMYGYFALEAYKGFFKESVDIGWKKRVTQLQIAQFCVGIVHTVMGRMYHGFCVWSTLYGLVFLLSFARFYQARYVNK